VIQPWSAVIVPADQGPASIARVARARMPHSWIAWTSAAGAVVPAPVFSAVHLPPSGVLELCELLADLDAAWLASAGDIASVYAQPLRPWADDGSPETWLTIPWILRGHGPLDCKALSAWRAAELRCAGEAARFVVDGALDAHGAVAYHVRIVRGFGTIEDPLRVMRRANA
jgi:hypothetical protein